MNIEILTNNANNQVFRLKEGGKTLTLEIPPFYGAAKSYLENDGGSKQQGATTSLYTKALEILQAQANRKGMPINYELETGFSSMRAWAANVGSDLFSWESVNFMIDDPQRIVAKTTIHPKQ